jgi:hypothetical protein
MMKVPYLFPCQLFLPWMPESRKSCIVVDGFTYAYYQTDILFLLRSHVHGPPSSQQAKDTVRRVLAHDGGLLSGGPARCASTFAAPFTCFSC